ncbi:hypothetical protein BC828DRAFT_392821 [Blastocladiella britannica]|nr:hypothetical protein BC828DRAFT_392821 [Blastocladiella britannica]
MAVIKSIARLVQSINGFLTRPKPHRLTREEIKQLARTTGFTETEVGRLYTLFSAACPKFHRNARTTAPDPLALATGVDPASAVSYHHLDGAHGAKPATPVPSSTPNPAAAGSSSAAPGGRTSSLVPPSHNGDGEREARPGHSDEDHRLRLKFRQHRVKQPPPTLDRATMRHHYARLFPFGDSRAFADRVFDVLDVNRDGRVGFAEYVRALATATREDATRDRLVWSFQLYDSDRDGFISRHEVLLVARALDELAGPLASTVNMDVVAGNDHGEEDVVDAATAAAVATVNGGSGGNGPQPVRQHTTVPIAVVTAPSSSAFSDSDAGGGGATLNRSTTGAPVPWSLEVPNRSASGPGHATPTNTARSQYAGSMNGAPPPSPTPAMAGSLAMWGGLHLGSPVPLTDRPGASWAWPDATVGERAAELERRVDRLFALLDVNGDGRVPFDEFVDAVQRNPGVGRAMNLFAGLH